MNLKELIAALGKLETVCGGDTDTECVGVALAVTTLVTYENRYYTREYEQKREEAFSINIAVRERDVPQKDPSQAANPYTVTIVRPPT